MKIQAKCSLTLVLAVIFFENDTKSIKNKGKRKQVPPQQTKNPLPLHSKRKKISKMKSGMEKSVLKHIAAATAKSLQSCPTLCDPIGGSPPGSSIHGTVQAGTLEWGCHFLLQCMHAC